MYRFTFMYAVIALVLSSVAAGQQPATAPATPLWMESRLSALPANTPAGPFITLADGGLIGVDGDAAVISRDGGATWERHAMWQPGAFKVRPEYAIVQSKTGAIVCLFINDLDKLWKWDNETNASAVDARLYVWSTRSTDGGKSWSDPVKVQDGYCGAVRDMIQTRDGHLVSPLQKFLPEHNRHATTPVISTDDGLTWQSAGLLDGGGRGHHDGSIEACLVERRDGSLLMLLRSCDDVFLQSVSTDGGRSWGALSPTTIDASSSPAIVKRLQSGRLMLAWNRLYPEGQTTYPRRAGQHSLKEASWHREELAIALSDDDGENWSKPVVVAKAPGKRVSYPFIVEPQPGVIWLTTMQGGLRAQLREADFAGAASSAVTEKIWAPVQVGVPGANEAVAVRMPDGELAVFFVFRPDGTEIRSVRSNDHGRTWSAPRTEFALPGVAYYGVQVTVDQAGELQCIFHILGKGDNGYNGRHYDLWHTKTTDARSKWTEPTKIYDGYVGSLRGFVTTKSGRLLLSVSVAVPARAKAVEGEPDYGWNDAVVFYSDDNGANWSQGSDRLMVLQDEARGKTRYGAVEPHLIEHLDGRLWMLIRTKNGFLWESTSTDGGTTWPQPTRTNLISSDSPVASARMRDGRLVLLLNACQRWDDLRNYAIGGRHVLHAAISSDDGKTWRGFREILRDDQSAERGDRGTSYASAVETAEGNVIVVSGQGEGKKHILLLSPDWIDEKSQQDDFSNGLSQWTTYEGIGAELVDHPQSAGGKMLSIRQTDPTGHAGAVWNFPAATKGELTMRLRLRGSGGSATIALNDHYNVVADTLAETNSLYMLDLRPLIKDDAWHDLKWSWESAGEAIVTLDGTEVARVNPLRSTATGINYLRVKSTGDTTLDLARVEARSGDARAEGTPRQPLFENGPVGSFDDRWATCPSVAFDGKTWRMWYSSFFTSREGPGGIGLAESDDGRTWRRNSDRALLGAGAPGSFDSELVFAPEVHPDPAGGWLMWYTGQSDRQHPSKLVTYQIGLARSSDGVRWTRAKDQPVLAVGSQGSPDEVQAATPTVLRDGNRWRMWYAAWSPAFHHTLCAATSEDGIHWARENGGQPVHGLNPAIAYGPAVARVDGRLVLLYMALGATRGLYAAESDDGLNWRMLHGGQPVLLPGKASFDGEIVGHPFLFPSEDGVRVFYTGYQKRPGGVKNWILRIGEAEVKL